MEKSESAKIFDEIVSALTEAGYEPLMQINGYLETGNITYITRKNNAREKILLLSHTDLENYIAKLKWKWLMDNQSLFLINTTNAAAIILLLSSKYLKIMIKYNYIISGLLAIRYYKLIYEYRQARFRYI